MKLRDDSLPKSSFLSMEKDLALITDMMLKNNRLKKLLFHNVKNALDLPNLTEDESQGLIGKNIKIVPKLSIDGSVLSYIIISFDNFTPNTTNPQFRDNVISFDVICHFDQWQLKDFQLRPYRIAAELDSMVNDKHLTGIGTLHFMGANQIVLNDEFAGLSLMYQAINGEEDKRKPLNPEQEMMLFD